MNEQTAKLVEQLAQKLGTTADYLWSVLLKQAPISAITDLVFFAFTIILGVVIYKVHKHLLAEKDGNNSIYYDLEEGAVVPMIFVLVIWAIMFIACLCSIGNIINGFLNPEYWALKEILSSLNQ
jgi:uncharacterized Tic20 family protein